jgi:hypothetical protein
MLSENNVVSRRLLTVLLSTALVLLVALAVLVGLMLLLGGLGDAPARGALKWVVVGVLVLLSIDLVCLLLALGLHAAGGTNEPPHHNTP